MNERPRFLADLANADRAMQTPRRVEAALRQRVARAHASRNLGVWYRFRPWWGVAATAAALLGLWLWTPKSPQAPPKLEAARLAQPAPPAVDPALSAASPQPATRAGSVAPLRRGTRPANALPSVAAPVQDRITRRFYELAYAPPELLANSRVLRVRVPRAALLSFGLPLYAYQAQDEKVAADVLYTEDGVARAIRFVDDTNSQE